jgi:hypothetical protein
MPKAGYTIKGMANLFSKIHARIKMGQEAKDTVVDVGYKAPYAVYVHENREIWPPGMRLAEQPRPSGIGAYWDPQGQAQPKFLEEPTRMMSDELGKQLVQDVKDGMKIRDAMKKLGETLLAASQELVPVETGELRDSGFVQIRRK